MANKPKLIIVTGRPGSGKTTLSKKLGERLHMPVLSRDEIKEGYVNTFAVRHDELPEDTNAVVSEAFFKTIDSLLSQKVSIIAEAAFQHKVWLPEITRWKGKASALLIICAVDEKVAAQRHLQRGIDDPKREFYHGDTRVTHYKETGEVLPPGVYEPPAVDILTIEVSTQDGYDPNIDIVCKQIMSATN